MFDNKEKEIFEELNSKLVEINQQLEIICAGGYILDRCELRSTEDIDAFYNTNEQINKAIEEVGTKYKINPKDELWLNNSIQSLNKKPPLNICQNIYNFSNLKVMIPPLDYIVCMKLKSARTQDISDVSKLIIKLNINVKQPRTYVIFSLYGITDYSMMKSHTLKYLTTRHYRLDLTNHSVTSSSSLI